MTPIDRLCAWILKRRGYTVINEKQAREELQSAVDRLCDDPAFYGFRPKTYNNHWPESMAFEGRKASR